jgi:glyoxylase-like metal-dependent hydrolase (beta-lactamase superfamily II)
VAQLIDVHHQGVDRVIGVWEVRGLVVDPGPEPCIETLLEGLGGRAPEALMLTHIHLDHSGGAGALVRRFPDLPVYVHERGAPHLADPEKLLASAGRLYGDQMEALWGEVLPVPERNLRVLEGGEEVEGLRVAYTPGHAGHHVAYFDPESRDALVGDVGGVRISEGYVVPPTPPPDIDLEAWGESLETIAAWEPRRLCLAHFGAVEDPSSHIPAVRAELERLAERARDGDREAFLAALRAEIAERAAPGDRDRIELAVPPEHVWLGLERYWAKRGVLEP